MVTSRDGSGISCPRLRSASNAELHSVPKWMLWWAAEEGGRPRTPTCQTTAEGE
jgi:hypothetical protein